MMKKIRTEKNVIADRDPWGYVMCFGMIIIFVASIGHVNSFGLIYNDFIVATNSTAKALTTAHGIFAIMLAVGGIILNIIASKSSLRLGGFIGAFMYIVGSCTTIVISNVNQLSLTFGLFQGIGFGMMVPVCYATLNYYFIKKRTTVMSVCKAVQGVILIGYPHFLKKILSLYGFRGTLLILSGIQLHVFAGMTTMKIHQMKHKISTANNLEQGTRLNENIELVAFKNSIVDNNDASTEKPRENKTKHPFWKIFNIRIIKDPSFINICIGQSFVNFSDLTFFILQPLLLFQYGYNRSDIATCISICAGADVTGRCALAIISSVIQLNTRLLFYLATIFTLILRIAIMQLRDFIWVAMVTGALGFLRAWLHIASPLVVSNHVPHEDFPGAYAFFTLITGIVNVIVGPLIGSLKDSYEDYTPAFFAIAACCAPCLILWPIEYIVKKVKKK